MIQHCINVIDIFEEYQYLHTEPDTIGQSVELDVYIPELNLAVEYQGQQHYKPSYWVTDFTAQQKLDEEKRNICQKVVNALSVLITQRLVYC